MDTERLKEEFRTFPPDLLWTLARICQEQRSVQQQELLFPGEVLILEVLQEMKGKALCRTERKEGQ